MENGPLPLKISLTSKDNIDLHLKDLQFIKTHTFIT